jgi:thiamine biosynthesis lipoprotein
MTAPRGMTAVETHRRSALYMDTLVSLHAITDAPADAVAASMDRAFGWFAEIEATCSRFEPESEVMRLVARAGEPVPVSETLFTLVEFALAVARASGGAFDPTVGHLLETRGYRRNYRTGAEIATPIAPSRQPTWRYVRLNRRRRTVTLRTPLVLDLGAVAKGFAIDLATRELEAFGNICVEAGGDMAVRGHNAEGERWHIGIRHPLEPGALIETVRLTDAAICTSGGYERPNPADAGDHHIVDPRTGHSPLAIASVTAIAPSAMIADALSTAAFTLGPEAGTHFLAAQGAEGLIFTPTLERHATEGLSRYLA